MRVLILLFISLNAFAQSPALYMIVTNKFEVPQWVEQISVITNDSGELSVGTNRVQVTQVGYSYTLIPTNAAASPAEIASPLPDGIPTGKWSEILSAVIAAIVAAVFHLYKQHKNKQVNASLVQGIETGIKVIEASPDGEAARDRYKEWLGFQQRSKGVQATIAKLVENQAPIDLLVAEQAAEKITTPEQPGTKGTEGTSGTPPGRLGGAEAVRSTMTNVLQLTTALLFQVADTNWTDARVIGYETNGPIPYPIEEQTGIRVTNWFISFSAISNRYIQRFETIIENPSTNPPTRIVRQAPNTFPVPGWRNPVLPKRPEL